MSKFVKFYEYSVCPMWSGWILDVGLPMRRRDLLKKMTQRKPNVR